MRRERYSAKGQFWCVGLGLCMLALSVSPAYGQWTEQSGVIHTTDANAKVGIGTASPIAKLHVNGAIQANNHTTSYEVVQSLYSSARCVGTRLHEVEYAN